MINNEKLKEVINGYKKRFVQEQWPDEKYKWVAAQQFQESWDDNAEDFAKMLKDALSKTENLLASNNNFPAGMILRFAEKDPETIREMFLSLYDESKELFERIQNFKNAADTFLKKEFPEFAQHYQNENSITTYLWLRYPDKYYIYKFGEVKRVAKEVGYPDKFKKGAYADNIRQFMELYDEICHRLQQDDEIKQMLQSQVEPDCYDDPELKTLTIDVGFYISRYWKKEAEEDVMLDNNAASKKYWIYAPGKNSSMWDSFYRDGIMAIGWSEIGDLSEFNSKDEMKEAMKEAYDPSFSYMNSAHATWQFANEVNEGDIVFVKKGRSQIVGRGIVSSDYEYDVNEDNPYRHVRNVKWTHKGEWTYPGTAALKTLTDITPYPDLIAELESLFESDEESDKEEVEKIYDAYSREKFLSDVFMDENEYNQLVDLLRIKKNIILQGAPGVGKTYVAKRLAYSMMGKMDSDRVMMVQFHQSYSYEDFIMGYRPNDSGGFIRRTGAFYNFCKKAEIDSDNEYFFIIDEINRGNLSKIFGELFMLIESDKRGNSLQLLYSDEQFSVPENVLIIGMMNTADRSLAMLDYALRRRFAFFDMKPGFETEGFKNYQKGIANEKFDSLITSVEKLNKAIAEDPTLGQGFCIGHSYFCGLTAETVDYMRLNAIVEYELIPLLKEYWFDEPSKVNEYSENLRGAIK